MRRCHIHQISWFGGQDKMKQTVMMKKWVMPKLQNLLPQTYTKFIEEAYIEIVAERCWHHLPLQQTLTIVLPPKTFPIIWIKQAQWNIRCITVRNFSPLSTLCINVSMAKQNKSEGATLWWQTMDAQNIIAKTSFTSFSVPLLKIYL